MLKETNSFSFIDQEKEERAVLLFEGSKHLSVPGSHLVLQLQLGTHYLLFLLGNIVYENALFIHYVDKDLQLIESLELSAAYATDDFTLVQLVPPNRVQFDFLLEKQIWELEVGRKPRWWVHHPFGIVKRKNKVLSRSYLSLRRKTRLY